MRGLCRFRHARDDGTMQNDSSDWFARTLVAALLGPAALVGLMLLWGIFFYRGYGEDHPSESLSMGFIVAAWIVSIFVALVSANRLRASQWVAGGVAVAAGLPIIIAMTIGIGIAACAGHWGSQSCLFS
jgi:hypothetical protein